MAADIVVVAINYRLAPENPFPAALMDTIETYNWLTTPRARGGVGVDPKRMIVMGDSAGGGLSTALGLALVHNEKNPLYNPLNYPFQSSAKQSITAEQLRNLKAPALLILLSPWLDLECKNASWTKNSEYCYLPFVGSQIGSWYAGHHNADQTNNGELIPLNHPLVSPVYGDLEGFPMTLLHVGESESLVEDARIFKEKAIKVGVKLSYEEFEDMCHFFHMFGGLVPEQAKKALSSIVNSIQLVAKMNLSNPANQMSKL